MSKETHTCEKRPTKETHALSPKRDPYLCKETQIGIQRPIKKTHAPSSKRDQYLWKETHISEKRPTKETHTLNPLNMEPPIHCEKKSAKET